MGVVGVIYGNNKQSPRVEIWKVWKISRTDMDICM